MLKAEFQVGPDAEDIVPIEAEPASAAEAAFGWLSAEAAFGEDVLTAYPLLTAPDRLMEGFELQEGPSKLYLWLDPKNAIQAMMAILAINLFNTSSTLLADANLRSCPADLRDINTIHGTKAAKVAADLLEKFHKMREGNQKNFKVGRVNVEAGGQAIVGNIQATRQRPDQPGRATKTSRRRKKNCVGRDR